METSFEIELTHLLNATSRENESNTPDFILANYLLNCYDAFVLATRAREKWYSCYHAPGCPPSSVPIEEEPVNNP